MKGHFCGVVFAVIGAVPAPLVAQTKQAVAIEAKLQRQLNSKSGSTTLGMVEAYDTAARAYALEIGRVYHKLEQGLPPIQREVLVNGQLAWQDYLKHYRVFVSYVYDADGSMHKHMSMSYLKEMLRHRLQELCAFFMEIQDDITSEDIPGVGDWCAEKHGELGLKDPLAAASQAAKAPSLKKSKQ